jgi:hypothetical protein
VKGLKEEIKPGINIFAADKKEGKKHFQPG